MSHNAAGQAGLLPDLHLMMGDNLIPDDQRGNFLSHALELAFIIERQFGSVRHEIVVRDLPGLGGNKSPGAAKLAARHFYNGAYLWSPLGESPECHHIRFCPGGSDWDVLVTTAADIIRIEIPDKRLAQEILSPVSPLAAFQFGVVIALAELYQGRIRDGRAEMNTGKMPGRSGGVDYASYWIAGFCSAILDVLRSSPGQEEHCARQAGSLWFRYMSPLTASCLYARAEGPKSPSYTESALNIQFFEGGYCAGVPIAKITSREDRGIYADWQASSIATMAEVFSFINKGFNPMEGGKQALAIPLE